VYNGADYDPWMDKLLAASEGKGRVTIVAAQLMARNPAIIRILVRPGDHADGGESGEPVSGPGGPGEQGRLRRASGDVPGIGETHRPTQSPRSKPVQGRTRNATEPVSFGYMSDAIAWICAMPASSSPR